MNAVVEQVDNPFANAPIAARPANDAMVATLSAREVAKVQTGMMIARRFPRDEVAAMDRILQACTRPTLAQSAVYEYARGGTDIRGASIRLAECIAGYWGHMDCGWKVVEERPGATKIETYAQDLQSGNNWAITFDVVHERTAHGKKTTITDPRDIYEHCANAAARRLRACILKVIPGDVVEAAVNQCEKTLVTKVDITPEKIKSMVDGFAEFGVTKAQIEKRIQRRVDVITPGLMVQLRKIYASLRDDMSVPGDWFAMADEARQEGAGDAQEKSEGAGTRPTVKSRLQARNQRQAPPPAPVNQASSPAPDAGPAVARGPSTALQDVINFSKAATTSDDIQRASSIAIQIEDEVEARIAQEHLDQARERISEDIRMGQPHYGHEGE